MMTIIENETIIIYTNKVRENKVWPGHNIIAHLHITRRITITHSMTLSAKQMKILISHNTCKQMEECTESTTKYTENNCTCSPYSN